MAISRRILVPALFLAAISPVLLLAVSPRHKLTSGVEDFLKGDFEGVALTSDGRLLLAPATRQLLDTKEAYVHAAAAGQGGVLFIGTGANGKIFRIQPDGTGGEWVKLEEPAVYALAVDSSNRLYAATSPDGKVYRISAEGKPEIFYTPGEKFIWDLAFDEQNNLYVATGPRGIVYKVTPDGKGESFFDSEETHIVRLVWDLDKNLLAGSAPGGQLYRVSPAGRPFVLVDSALEEFKSIAVDRYGNIYAAAISGGPTVSAVTQNAAKKTENGEEAESTVEVSGAAKGGKLEVYRIDREHMVETLYSSDDELAFDVLVRSDGSVLIATGNKGRIVSVGREGFSTLLVDTREEQVTRILERGNALLVFTSNLGKVYRVNGDAAEKGTYESEVLDAGVVSQWGLLKWRVTQPAGTSPVRLFARSGNTRSPDRTWTDWTGPYTDPAGSPLSAQPARYLQWKVEFTSEARSEALLSQQNGVDLVGVSYQQKNVGPRVTGLTILSPGVALAKPPSNPSGGVTPGGPEGAHARVLPSAIRDLDSPKVSVPSRKVYVPGARSLTWKASDANGDILSYAVYSRRVDAETWTLLKEGLTDEEYTLDGASFPDGTYLFKVVVSDRLSNPPGLALESELVSKPFDIANSAPRFEWQPVQVNGKSAVIRFGAATDVSVLFQVEYSVDGGDWKLAFPEDGICDSRQENFRIEVGELASGTRTIALRGSDTVGNLGTSSRSFQVP